MTFLDLGWYAVFLMTCYRNAASCLYSMLTYWKFERLPCLPCN